MSSFGPEIQLVNFEKIIGSFGIGKFCSIAWSLKFSPIPINFEGLDTQAPTLWLLSNIGKFFIFSFFIFSKVSKLRVLALSSFIIDDKSL